VPFSAWLRASLARPLPIATDDNNAVIFIFFTISLQNKWAEDGGISGFLSTFAAEMKIGEIDLGERPVMLAPMEDVTDIGFRMLCKRFGAAMVYTEFVSAEALVRDVKTTVSKLSIRDEERPVGIQIYGRDTEAMVEAAKIVEQAGPDLIDLNFGCPVKKVAGKGAGAGMLQNIPKMLEITRGVVQAVKLPVTVKTRLGWNHEQLIITELAEQLQDCGIKALTIHGRTRSQMYTGQADWTLIGEVKRNPRIHIPIIGNGDIHSLEEADRAFDTYGVDGVMIGRATFGCPWIFSRQELSTRQKLDTLLELLSINVERIDEKRGILHTRRHLAATPLFKGIPNFRQTRIAMLRAETVEELTDIIRNVESNYL
jgi:nifR3 family TIM-barrel protein